MINGKLLANAFPINKIEVFFDDLDHSTFLGFTWERVGDGRVPVGLDTTDTNFNAIGKTGGSKEMQQHRHQAVYGSNSASGDLEDHTYESVGFVANGTPIAGAAYYNTRYEGNGNSGNLQPYIVMAFWKRVA